MKKHKLLREIKNIFVENGFTSKDQDYAYLNAHNIQLTMKDDLDRYIEVIPNYNEGWNVHLFNFGVSSPFIEIHKDDDLPFITTYLFYDL